MTASNQTSARARARAVLASSAVLLAALGALWLYLARQTEFVRVESVAGEVVLYGRDLKTGRPLSVRPEPGMTQDADCRVLLAPGARIVLSILDRGLLVVEAPGLPQSAVTQEAHSADIRLYKQRTDWWRLDEGRAWLVTDNRDDDDPCRDLRFDLAAGSTNLRAGGVLRLRIQLHSTNTLARVGGMLADASLVLVPAAGAGQYTAQAGLDCMLPEGMTRLALWVHGKDGAWYMRSWRLPVQKFSPDREGVRLLARRARPFPRSAYPPAPPDWWQRWLDKKKEIMSGGKPEREYWRLQRVYRTSGKREGEWRDALLVPIARYDSVSSPYGVVRYLTSTNGRAHRGIDFASPEGVDVTAPQAGRVAFAHETAVHGGLVILDHGEGVFSTFMHLSRVVASSNAYLPAGEVVGRVGTTGLSTGPHLHYEMRVGNRCVDPTPWFLASPLAGEPEWIRLPE